MIAIFRDANEIIIVGLNADGSPMDADGTLFGPESGRNIDEFQWQDLDTDSGQTAHIETVTALRLK